MQLKHGKKRFFIVYSFCWTFPSSNEHKKLLRIILLLVSNFSFLLLISNLFFTLSTNSFIWVLCTFFHLHFSSRKMKLYFSCLRFKRAQHIKWGEIAVPTPTHVAVLLSTNVKYWLRLSTLLLPSQRSILKSSETCAYLQSDYSPLLLFSQLKTWLLLDLKLGGRSATESSSSDVNEDEGRLFFCRRAAQAFSFKERSRT